MTDLRTRIAAVQAQHHHWDYAGALTCACGETFGLGVEAGWDAAVAGWAVHVADAVIRELPQPVKPNPPELENLTAIPAQKHVWGREWDADYHQGYFCTECEKMSDCESCSKDWKDGDDCLVIQAENRNKDATRRYEKNLERWESQMDYWRELTGRMT